ncbi:MAG: hypothetical protein LBP86_00560 [Azoarcus sp.]|jgi:hypothetical protein|nr:hypothetical protein [Azoarcus sp.]
MNLNTWMFDPPGFAISQLPKWHDYIVMLERAVIEDDDPEEAQAELAAARRTLAELEAWRDEEEGSHGPAKTDAS